MHTSRGWCLQKKFFSAHSTVHTLLILEKPCIVHLYLILFRVVSSASGVVRLEQKNDTFLEMGIYDDGPFEVGDENEKNPDLVPAPPNSYLGKSQLAH